MRCVEGCQYPSDAPIGETRYCFRCGLPERGALSDHYIAEQMALALPPDDDDDTSPEMQLFLQGIFVGGALCVLLAMLHEEPGVADARRDQLTAEALALAAEFGMAEEVQPQ